MNKYLYDLRRLLLPVIILLVLLDCIPFIIGDNKIQIGVYGINHIYVYLNIVLTVLIFVLLTIVNAPTFMKVIGTFYTIFIMGGIIMGFLFFGSGAVIDISGPIEEKIYIRDNSFRGDESFKVYYRNTPLTVKNTGIEYNNTDLCKSVFEWDDDDLVFSCDGQEKERYDIKEYIN